MPRPPTALIAAFVLVAFLLVALLSGCSRPQRTAEQSAGPVAPPDLRRGPTPPGGPSMSPTGAGAGGSAAAGTEAERVGGRASIAVRPEQPPGFMAPVGSSGSGLGDRGRPLDPAQPVVTQNAQNVTQPLYANPQHLPPNVRTGGGH